jgi:hypothetical protein
VSLRALYGVAGLTAPQLEIYVSKVAGGCFSVAKGSVHKSGEIKGLACVLFLGIGQFLRYNHRITKDYVAFVIDAPENLSTIQGLLSLGYTVTRSGNCVYTPLGASEVLDCMTEGMLSESGVQWSHVPMDPLKIIVQNDDTDEVMNRLRTLMYTIPNKDLRAEVSASVFLYITHSQSLVNTSRRLGKVLGYDTKEKIRRMLVSPMCQTLRQAYLRYKVKPSSAEAICKAFKVSMFTLRYLEAKTKVEA